VSSGSPSLKRELGKQDQSLCGAIDRIALRRAIEELPRGARQIFELHEFEGYEHHEIAELLQCSIGNSKSQLHKAKKTMRDFLFPQRILRRPRASDGAASVAKSQNDPSELSSSRRTLQNE
jgi:DNA-directed RNA polymerase specialized sigma24 family protein